MTEQIREQLNPRAWVGCLACYNAGRLLGVWVTGVEAGEVSHEAIHPVGMAAGHEELWVFDHEGYGGLLPGECSPENAQSAARLLVEAGDRGRGVS